MLVKWHDALSSTSYTARLVYLYLLCFICAAFCKDTSGVLGAPHVAALRKETEELFYHGFENYMRYAFPEDELRPLSCKPLTRDRENPNHVEVNDVLGNYSLTLIDSLSTLAILASSPSDHQQNKPLTLFQNGVRDLVEQYGDGTDGPQGQGKRSRAFALDSKVQVFETAIRGLGGLLSAHLFAVGELPIAGYTPHHADSEAAQRWNATSTGNANDANAGIEWPNGFVYDGQLLRLAYDLGQRLVPAFWTSTGIPYPRVNLRYGIPFHAKSAGNFAPEGQCETEKQEHMETTETCSAGAASLVLEFTVLSRLTDTPKFEELAKRAFWAIWNRRSGIDLIGSGIDAETGSWQHSWTGIGAGIDSFFEYAFKTHILLSGNDLPVLNSTIDALDPRSLFGHLPHIEHASDSFLRAWNTAHAAIKRHMYRGTNFQHPHYIQVDLVSGAPRAFWIDALSAFYPGLLTLSGQVEEAIEIHLVFAALWARFSALPERYSVATGNIEGGLGWWVGRPELIESTWYLYSATKDPWYIYVGEMIMRDIKRRCWTACGWAGIQNVVTGEKIDRMESFFLGETVKYLFLLFDPRHPLNKLDAPFVFTTEGHPLIIPPGKRGPHRETHPSLLNDQQCPIQPAVVPFTVSNISARGDMYHAASLARLHLMPKRGQVDSVLTEYAADHPSITLADVQSPSNWTYYPWTLPLELVPHNATSLKMPVAPTFELSFPIMQNQAGTSPPLQRVDNGIMINFLGGLRLSMVQDVPLFVNDVFMNGYRIQGINNVALGKDERVYLAHGTGYKALNPHDPLFSRARDTTMLDVVVDPGSAPRHVATAYNATRENGLDSNITRFDHVGDGAIKSAWESIMSQISHLVQDAQELMNPILDADNFDFRGKDANRLFVPATTPTGAGAAPLPDWPDVGKVIGVQPSNDELPWKQVYAAGELCDGRLASNVVRSHQVILIKRGACSFSQKLSNFPTVHPGKSTFELAIIVDYEHTNSESTDNVFGAGSKDGDTMIRPLLEQPQTMSSGLYRQHPIPMVMVRGGEQIYQVLKHARGIGVKRRYSVSSQGVPIANLMMV